MRTYIPIVKLLERDPEWAARVRARDVRKRRRHRNSPAMRARVMRQGVKDEARRKGIEFDLSLEWFETRLKVGVCELSGLPFDFERGGKTAKPNAPSIDRIAPGGHYTETNCRMILFSINRALWNWGEDYVLSVFRHVLARRG
jgi:hypothetical protein